MSNSEKNLLNGLKVIVILIMAFRLFFVIVDNKFKEVQASQESKQEVALPKGEMEVDILLSGGREQEGFIAAFNYFGDLYQKTDDPIAKRRILIQRNSYFKRIINNDFKIANWRGTLKEKHVNNRYGDLSIAISIAKGVTLSGYENSLNADYFDTNIKVGTELSRALNKNDAVGKDIIFSGRFVKNWQPNFNGNHHNLVADNLVLDPQDEATLMTDLNLFFKLEKIEIIP